MSVKVYRCKHCRHFRKRRVCGSTCSKCDRKKSGEEHWTKVLQANEVNSNVSLLPCPNAINAYEVQIFESCSACRREQQHKGKDSGFLSKFFIRLRKWLATKRKHNRGTPGTNFQHTNFQHMIISPGSETDSLLLKPKAKLQYSPSMPQEHLRLSDYYIVGSPDNYWTRSNTLESALPPEIVCIRNQQVKSLNLDVPCVLVTSEPDSCHTSLNPESVPSRMSDQTSWCSCSTVSSNQSDSKLHTSHNTSHNTSQTQHLSDESMYLQASDMSWSIISQNDKLLSPSWSKKLNKSDNHSDTVSITSSGHSPLTCTISCPQKSATSREKISEHALCSTWPPTGKAAQLPIYADANFEESVFEDEEDDRRGSRISLLHYSLGDCTIPFMDLEIRDCLKVGRRQEIYKGRWFGDVIIHVFSDLAEDEVKPFLTEVNKLRMIRHENVTLFMGACIEPPSLAVITSVPRGMTLYQQIHLTSEKSSHHAKLSIIRQIAQAMGYLHARGIILRMITTRNIFLDSKVKISVMDHGIPEIKYDRADKGCVPRGYLTYIAPEVLSSIRVEPPSLTPQVKFTKATDVFSFGTILYEIACVQYPYTSNCLESLIWRVCSGRRQSLCRPRCLPSVGTLIQKCWMQNPDSRPEFLELSKELMHTSTLHKRHSSSEPEVMNWLGLSCAVRS